MSYGLLAKDLPEHLGRFAADLFSAASVWGMLVFFHHMLLSFVVIGFVSLPADKPDISH